MQAWSGPASVFKGHQYCSQRARDWTCPCGQHGRIGQQVSRTRIPPSTILHEKAIFFVKLFFPVNYIIGRSWLYTPIYADTVLYINCYIKHAKWAKKYNLSKIIRLDWQMLILNMSVYIVDKRFS